MGGLRGLVGSYRQLTRDAARSTFGDNPGNELLELRQVRLDLM